MFYEGINAKVFRRSIAFAIAVVVAPLSGSLEYTISVHAVHAGAERNACNNVVSTKTPQTSTNPSQTAPRVQTSTLPPVPPQVLNPRPPQPLAQPFAQMRYRCKYQVLSTGPNILEVYIIYLSAQKAELKVEGVRFGYGSDLKAKLFSKHFWPI